MKLACTDSVLPEGSYTQKAAFLKEVGFDGMAVFAEPASWNDKLMGELLDLKKNTGISCCEFVFMGDVYGHLMDRDPGLPRTVFYALRTIYHTLLFAILHQYVIYTCEATALSRQRRKPYVLIASALFIIFSIADAVGIFTGRTMHIVDGMISFEGSTIFTIGYVLFVSLLTVLLIRVRRRLYRQVMIGFFGVEMISIIVLAAARLRMQSTYTASTFLFPLIAVMYLLHSNPYDALLGANDLRGLNNLIHYSDEKQREYLFLSLYMRELDESGATLSEEMRTLIRHVAESYYRGSTLFQVSNGHMILMVPISRNPDYEERTRRILEQFDVEYENFRYDFKMVIGQSTQIAHHSLAGSEDRGGAADQRDPHSRSR